MSALQQFSLLACALFAVACGSTVNAGNPVPGGAPGNPCVAANTPVGCYTDPATATSSIVNCPSDVSPATWTAGAACGAGTHCVVTSKTEASCAANPVVVVNDTVSGSKDSDNGSACVAAKCAKETSACTFNLTCTNALKCLADCKSDQKCQDACGAALSKDPAGTKIFQDYFQCAMTAAFSCGGTDAGATDISTSKDTSSSKDTSTSMDSMTGPGICGNGSCEADESASTCAFDCNTAYAGQAACIWQSCANQWGPCMPQQGCLFAVNCSLACANDPSCLSACQSDALDPTSKAMFACAAKLPCWAE